MSQYRPIVTEFIVAAQAEETLSDLADEEARAVVEAMERLLVSIPDTLEE